MTDRAVVMVTVDPTHAEFVRGLVRDALKAAYDDGVALQRAWGPVHLLEDADADLAYDVLSTPAPGGGRHVLRVDDERWHLEHSLICRRAGLELCPMNQMVSVGMDQPLWGVGEHELRLEAGTLLWGDDL